MYIHTYVCIYVSTVPSGNNLTHAGIEFIINLKIQQSKQHKQFYVSKCNKFPRDSMSFVESLESLTKATKYLFAL